MGGSSHSWNSVPTTLNTASNGTSLPLLPAAKQGCGATQLERGCHGVVHPQGEGATRIILGRGGLNGRLHSHPVRDTRHRGKTPYEAYHGKSLTVHYFGTFCYVAHVNDMRLNSKKLAHWSRKAIFIRYECGSNAYHCCNIVDQCVIIVMSPSMRRHSGARGMVTVST
jgi:hypothetical protein